MAQKVHDLVFVSAGTLGLDLTWSPSEGVMMIFAWSRSVFGGVCLPYTLVLVGFLRLTNSTHLAGFKHPVFMMICSTHTPLNLHVSHRCTHTAGRYVGALSCADT